MDKSRLGGIAVADKPNTPRRSPGRPLQLSEVDRRERLRDAAENVFVEVGYTAASMDDIARRAGMSKKTVYQLFDDKQSLFAAVIAARKAEFAAMFSEDDISDTHSAEQVLCNFLGKVAHFMLAPRQIALYRLVIAETQRAPELARTFHDEGSNKPCQALKEWMARQNEQGTLRIDDLSANMLWSMVVSEPQTTALISDKAPDTASISDRVRQAVDLFLAGARARAASSYVAPPAR